MEDEIKAESAGDSTPHDRQRFENGTQSPEELNEGVQTVQALSPGSKPTIWIQEPIKDQGDEDKSVQSDSFSRQADVSPAYTMTVVHSRRNANGTIGSVYSGNKIRHLKKEDGIPLWRKDIQFSFLRAVFEDKTPVFTLDVDSSKGHTFADIYIHAMARSSKTSKVLREKLLSDRESAMNMAMICLLVNVGRMNTTLNFFPEMRAQLRTYHSIPCLQVHQDSNSQYKGLQDAPRLKSILKGSCEDSEQPNSIEKIQSIPVPRTNPVNLIFVLSQLAPKISEAHFFAPRDFFDLVIRSTLSSQSRAKAFLWLIWWYLESDFSREAAENNPFGPGLQNDEDPDGIPIKIPAFEHLTEEQANAENVDTEEEEAYGEKMRLVRKRILEEDETVGPPMKKTAGLSSARDGFDDKSVASPARSEVDRTRSPSPTVQTPLNMPKPRRIAANNREDSSTPRSEMEKPQPPARLILKPGKLGREIDSSSPIPLGAGHTVPNSTSSHTRRARPETSHQRAVNMNRRMRIDKILHKKLVSVRGDVLNRRRREASTQAYLAMTRIFDLPADYDSEDESSSWGPGGIVPNIGEEEDYGGEAMQRKKVLDRAARRLTREERGGPLKSLTRASEARKRKLANGSGHEERGRKLSRTQSKSRLRGGLHSRNPGDNQGEALDDLDLDLLGEGRPGGGYDTNDDSGIDDSEGAGGTDDEMEDSVLSITGR